MTNLSFNTLSVLAVCSILVFTVATFWPDIVNVILSTNASKSRHLPIMMEYFIDQEKYFYLIILHIIASLYIGAVVTLAIGTTIITYLQHVCGMLKIARYR